MELNWKKNILDDVNIDNEGLIRRSQFIKKNENKLIKNKQTQDNEKIDDNQWKLAKNLLKNDLNSQQDENDNILGKELKMRRLQQLNKELVAPNIQFSQKNQANSQPSPLYSTNCSTSLCSTCQLRPYQVRRNTYSFQTQQLQTTITKRYFEICRQCHSGYYPYLYQKIKNQLILIKQTNKDGGYLQELMEKNMGKVQNCHENQYKVYEANMVIDSVEVEAFKKNKLQIANTIAKILQQYQAKKQDVDILYVKQGSIILDFWYKLDKNYTMNSAIVADSKEKILQGDIISFKVQQAQKTDPVYKKQQAIPNNANQNTDDNSGNNSFNKLLLPIIIAGGVSGLLIAIVIYFVFIRKKKQQEQQNQQNLQNPQNKKSDNVQNQHETSLEGKQGKQKIKNIKIVNASEKTEKTSKQGAESYDDLTRPSESQNNLYYVDL